MNSLVMYAIATYVTAGKGNSLHRVYSCNINKLLINNCLL